MKKVLYLSVFVLFSVVIYVFNDGKDNNAEQYGQCQNINIDSLPFYNLFVRNNQVDSCRFVPLELTDKSVVGNVKKILVCDTVLFVHDYQKNIFAFNLEGEFLYKLGTIGRAKNELLTITDFFVDDIFRIVSLYDAKKNVIQEYDLSGNYLGTKKCDSVFQDATDIIKLPDGNLLLTMSYGVTINYNFYVVDGNDYCKKKGLLEVLYQSKYYGRSVESRVFSLDGQCCASKVFGNVIYSYNDKNYFPKFKIIGDKMRFLNEDNKSLLKNCNELFDAILTLKDNNYFQGIPSVMTTSKYVLLKSITYAGQQYNIFWDLKNNVGGKHLITSSGTYIENSFPLGIYGDSFIFVLTPHIFIRDKQIYSQWQGSNIIDITDVELDDNPIIAFLYIK